MHCFNLTAPYAVLTKLVALRLECVHYRLNWAEKGVGMYLSKSATIKNDQNSDLKVEIASD